MKKLFAIVLAGLCSMPALAQTYPAPTFNSLILQNPLTTANGGTGATSSTGTGSVVLSNSPALTTPNLGTPSAVTLTHGTGLPLSGLAAQTANTITGNGTASTASPTALPAPSCSTSASALQWTSGTGLACNTAINAATLGGATFTAPGAIGSTTAGTGAFTNLSATGTVTVPAHSFSAQAINYGAGINTLSTPALNISLFGETPGSEYVASGGVTLTDNSSHAGIGHAAYNFSSNPVGTGAIGPLNADFAATFSVLKQNFSASPTAGEIDGAYFVARNGGSNSDTTGALFDVANYGQGFNAALEGNTNAIVGGTVTQTVDTQVGVVDTRSSRQYGYVATKTTGAGNGIAYYAQNLDTSGGTGQWQHLMQFGGGGCTGFDMPISTGDVVTMLMSDCTGGSKLFGVTGNDYYIENAAQTQRLLQLNDTGDLTNSGSFATGATTVTTLNASGNDALLYQNSSSQIFTSGISATVTGWTKVSDRVNANFNPSTGVFTAPASGIYQVSGQLQFDSAGWSAPEVISLAVVANGTTVANGETWIQASVTSFLTCSVSAIVSLAAGQTIVVQGFQNTGAVHALSGVATNNYLSINRLP
jgi:hypothetical protein